MSKMTRRRALSSGWARLSRATKLVLGQLEDGGQGWQQMVGCGGQLWWAAGQILAGNDGTLWWGALLQKDSQLMGWLGGWWSVLAGGIVRRLSVIARPH